MFSNAKVGQRVWSYTYGLGEIVKLNPVEVEFRMFPNKKYNKRGKFCDDCERQDLFYDEIKIEIPESAKKPKVEWNFPCYGVNDDLEMIVYFKEKGIGTIVKGGEIGFESNNYAMSFFTPCTLEAKEL